MVATNTTTTVTTTTNTRDGTKLTVSSQANTVSVGNYVTDVSIQPYIANRIISFFAYNMRPSQRLHIFFDSLNVDAYCAPGSRDANNQYVVPTNSSDWKSVSRNGDWGSAIYSDSSGRVTGQFNIPAGKFKTGDRSLQIADVDSIVYGNDAITSISSAIFTASNLSVTKQGITLTTVNPELGFLPVKDTVVVSNTVVKTTTIGDNVTILPPPPPPPPPPFFFFGEPVAQALSIETPNGEAGIYATSIEVFFRQKSQVQQNGVTVYICETDNGYPDGSSIIPFSRVHKLYEEISTSADATVSTKFTFEAPVFLLNKRTYAFVIKPDSNDPDYQIYTANLGDVDITTGYQVFSQPALGTAFYGATEKQWTALQKEYVKFKLYRAAFNKNEGEAFFYNDDNEYIQVQNIGYANTSGSILSGDYVFKAANSGTNSTGGSVTSDTYAVVDYYDSVKGIIYCGGSTGNFAGTTYIQVHRFSSSTRTPNNNTIIAYANCSGLYNPVVDALVPQLATIAPAGTAINTFYKGTSNNYTVDGDDSKVNIGYENEFYDQERLVLSRSNEVSSMSGNKSLLLKTKLRTDSEFLSPAIDIAKYQQLVIKNDVDPVGFQYDEFFNSGNAKSKYVSQVVTLAAGQDAEDLQVVITAFRPVGSDVEVWAKFVSGDDPQLISQKTWVPLLNESFNLYSDPSNPNDFKEFVYKVGSYYIPIGLNGVTTSSNTSNVVTGTSTNFTTQLSPGWFVNYPRDPSFSFNEQTRKVVSITNDNQIVLDAPFIGNYTNKQLFLVPPPTTAWLAVNNAIQATGTVTTSTTNNVIIGSSTVFQSEFKPGNIISINGDSQVVVSVSNNTYLTVGTPWSSTVSGANAFNVAQAGITYLNAEYNLYSTIKQFQLKIILKSDDSSKVPIIDDLRTLALQL